MSDIQPLTESYLGVELNNVNSNDSGDELVGNPAFIKALEVVVLRNIPRLLIPIFEPLVRRVLTDNYLGVELNNVNTNDSGDELVGNPAFIKARRLLMSIFEPLVRRVVKEEIEKTQPRFSTSTTQNSGERVVSPQSKNLMLKFRDKFPLVISTGNPILGEENSPIKIDLIDENTGLVVYLGPESSGRVEIVVLQVDPNEDERHEWTSDKFNKNVVKGSIKNKYFLNGQTFLTLKEGTGSLGKISFPHGAKWMKQCSFMLGARFVNSYDGITIKEAKSECFVVKDRRLKLDEKPDIPDLADKVLRLKNIRKGGKYMEKLIKANIETVEHFLVQYFLNRKKLQAILDMPNGKFSATVEHALTCKRDKRFYYPPNSQQQTVVVFDDVGEIIKVLHGDDFVSVDRMSENEKANARILITSAFENWGDVVPYCEDYLPSSSTSLVIPNNPLYSPTLKIPSPYAASDSQPIASSPPHIIFPENPHENVVDVHVQARTSLPLSEYINDRSHFNNVHDETQETVSPPLGMTSPNIRTTYCIDTNLTASGLDWQPDDDFIRDMLRSSPLHAEGQGFDDPDGIFNYTYVDVDEDFNTKGYKNWIQTYVIMKFVVRMKTNKTGHVCKRTRFQ